MSAFQNNSLDVDTLQNREEEEELEEQRRRQEELADLLAAGIDEFNYEDSTLNSSMGSVEAPPSRSLLKYEESNRTLMDETSHTLAHSYKDMGQEEQLKVLYEVRVREIKKLREEFEQFKTEKLKESNILKNKATLAEAEMRHLQITLKNSESLLVEKNETVGVLRQGLVTKDKEIQDLKKILEEQNLEICTYKSTVAELQMKLADSNPFSAGARKQNSEEVQKVHQDKIIKLETLLQEQSKKCQIIEKEKASLTEELQKLLQQKNEIEQENDLTIMGLSKKLQNAQQQCKDLFDLGEAVKAESDHFKERLKQLESNKLELPEDFPLRNLDKESIAMHLEKLRRMLLDKDVELNTLKIKLKLYNSDFQELFNYREMLSTLLSHEVKPCNNLEHGELIIFLQRKLQSLEQAIQDRNKQLMKTNLVNKELQEKIEETIQQTRTDIQNISRRYSLPQLETMSNELKNAEETINTLKRQNEELGRDKDKLQQIIIKDKDNLESIHKELMEKSEENSKLHMSLVQFRKNEAQLLEENEAVKTQLQKICLKLGLSESDILDGDVHEVTKYGVIHEKLQKVLAHLENTNIKNNFDELQKAKNDIFALKLESEEHIRSVQKLNDQIQNLKTCLQLVEDNKQELEKQLENTQTQLNDAKQEVINLRKELNDVTERIVKGRLEKELKEVEDDLEKTNENVSDSDVFQKCLKAELLKMEIVLRDRFQDEYIKKLQNVEQQYKNVLTEKFEVHKNMKEKWQLQETSYRKQFADILEECGRKMQELEDENMQLRKQAHALFEDYKAFKKNVVTVTKYNKIVDGYKKVIQELNAKWVAILESYMITTAKIEKQRQKSVNRITQKVNLGQAEVNLIENLFDEKIKKFKAEIKLE